MYREKSDQIELIPRLILVFAGFVMFWFLESRLGVYPLLSTGSTQKTRECPDMTVNC